MDTKGSNLKEADLQRAIKSMLIKRNDFSKIRAELRSKIIEILREKDVDSLNTAIHTNDSNANTKPQTILNKLILQYFSWFGYKYASEVFSTESGVNQTEVDCSDIVSQINMKMDKQGKEESSKGNGCNDKDMPILLNIIINMMIDE